jgi:hypothetical protein
MKYRVVFYATTLLLFVVVAFVWRNHSMRNSTMDRVIRILYRQCGRWAVAAEQDKSDIIAVLHANYAAGYLWAMKDIVSTDQFKQITGADFLDFEAKIVRVQDDATRRLVERCSGLVPISDREILDAIYGKTKK